MKLSGIFSTNPRNSISRKIVFYIILFSSIITLAGTSFQLYIEYRRDIGSIEKSIRQVENSYFNSITESLWVSNYRFLNIQLEGILRLSDIKHLAIYYDDKILTEAGVRPENNLISKVYRLERNYKDTTIYLGTLFVTASKADVYKRLTDRVIVTLCTQAVKTFFVVLFMLFIFYYLVGRHLHTLALHAKNLDAETLGTPVSLNRRRESNGDDEFDLLVNALNHMHMRLGSIFTELSQKNIQLNETVIKQKSTEKALLENQNKLKKLTQEFQAILDGLPDSLLLMDTEQRIIWANRGTAEMTGQDQNSLKGRYCYSLWFDRTEACSGCLGLQCFEDGTNKSGQALVPDGRVLEKKVFPIKDADGNVVNIIEWSSDITEKQKLAEESLRAGQLASLGELAAGVAHEINNPNSLVLLNTALADKIWKDTLPVLNEYHRTHGELTLAGIPFSELRDEVPLLYSEMLDGAERIKRIVNDLKDFVRQDEWSVDDSISINDAVEIALRLCTSAVKKATDKFFVKYDRGLEPSRGNRQRIEQVVINLLLNACQALTGKDQAISILTGYDKERNMNFVRISDEGEGIMPENVERVTEPFFTTKRERGGTGLGLSVSSRIIKEHKGYLLFDSRPGEGTSVSLHIPLYESGEHDE